jgi:hypothetical protein
MICQERMTRIKEIAEWRKGQATRILKGGENYDGADGARNVLQLTEIVSELIDAIESKEKETAV